jgi:hypothetical protein
MVDGQSYGKIWKGEMSTMLITLDTAGLPVMHERFEVRVHVTWSLFNGVNVYDELFVPTLLPFTFH